MTLVRCSTIIEQRPPQNATFRLYTPTNMRSADRKHFLVGGNLSASQSTPSLSSLLHSSDAIPGINWTDSGAARFSKGRERREERGERDCPRIIYKHFERRMELMGEEEKSRSNEYTSSSRWGIFPPPLSCPSAAAIMTD